MITIEEISSFIKQSFLSYEPKSPDVWLILVDNKRIALRSGKHMWTSLHAAKCALSNHYKEILPYYVSKHDLNFCKGQRLYMARMCKKMFKKECDNFIVKHVRFSTLRDYLNEKEKDTKNKST